MNIDRLQTAYLVVHERDDRSLAAARVLLADWDPNEPDAYNDLDHPALVFVTLTAYVNDPGAITQRAARRALEIYYEMH